ncbi:MAG: ATP-dependent sacrificial sulfur transferase LarE [Syntrophotaleaceae bacterium]
MKKVDLSGHNLGTAEKTAPLKDLLGSFPTVAVAFSGGVDSTLLLKTAADTLGADKVLALTVQSAFLPAWELDESRRIASSLGIRQIILTFDILQIPEVAANGPRRCYHCKRAIMALCLEKAAEYGGAVLLDGSNLDDLRDYRPGREALLQLGIRSPLLEAGLTKQDIRYLSRQMHLPTAEKAAFACLATRIPYQQPLSPEKLGQVEICEDFLYRLGFSNFRARHHGDTVRIEIAQSDLPRVLEQSLRAAMIETCKGAGFRYVTLDLEGYRTGRMNEELS